MNSPYIHDIGIEFFYENRSIDPVFDYEYYRDLYSKELKDFYQPVCNEKEIDDEHRLYYHYFFHGRPNFKFPSKEAENGISIILACKNRSENLPSVLENWIKEEDVIEIILVDFSSDEPVAPIVKHLTDKHKNIKIIRVDNQIHFNLGKAYNLAFDHCNCKYVMKIDADYVCKDSKFIKKYLSLKDTYLRRILLRGFFGTNLSTSGFFLTDRRNYMYFREDLNGYGYDETDLYDRIVSKNKKIKIISIILFNIEDYIYHIPHSDKKRSENYSNENIKVSNTMNQELCRYPELNTKLSRNSYYLNQNKNIEYEYNSPMPDKTFCINLKSRKDRWDNMKSLSYVERFNAVDASSSKFSLEKYGLAFNPCTLSDKIYFTVNSNAFGAYLSHYTLWKKIVKENINHALILEDDINPVDLSYLQSSNLMYKQYDLVNLSYKTVIPTEDKTFVRFDGAEAYILSLSGAKKLIAATNHPKYLNKIVPNMDRRIINYENFNWDFDEPSICAALDKFLGYCCQDLAHEDIKLDHLCYPLIDLDLELSSKSDIYKTSAERLSNDEIELYAKELKT